MDHDWGYPYFRKPPYVFVFNSMWGGFWLRNVLLVAATPELMIQGFQQPLNAFDGFQIARLHEHYMGRVRDDINRHSVWKYGSHQEKKPEFGHNQHTYTVTSTKIQKDSK